MSLRGPIALRRWVAVLAVIWLAASAAGPSSIGVARARDSDGTILFDSNTDPTHVPTRRAGSRCGPMGVVCGSSWGTPRFTSACVSPWTGGDLRSCARQADGRMACALPQPMVHGGDLSPACAWSLRRRGRSTGRLMDTSSSLRIVAGSGSRTRSAGTACSSSPRAGAAWVS